MLVLSSWQDSKHFEDRELHFNYLGICHNPPGLVVVTSAICIDEDLVWFFLNLGKKPLTVGWIGADWVSSPLSVINLGVEDGLSSGWGQLWCFRINE